MPRSRSDSFPCQAFQNISLHCTTSSFLNGHTPLLFSFFESHCCPWIKICFPGSVDKRSILPLPFIVTDESFTYEVKRVKPILWFPAWSTPWQPFHLQRGLLYQVRRQGPCSIKALPHQASKTMPTLSAPQASVAVSTLLSPHFLSTSPENQRPRLCRGVNP